MTPSPARLLVRAPNWLGDAVLSLAAVRDLRASFPAARLEVLARPSVAALYGAVAEVDAVRTSAGARADAAWARGAFDAAVLLPNSFGAAFAAWRAGIPERWGYATDGRRPLLTRAVSVPRGVRGRSQVYYYRAMLAGLGLTVTDPPRTALACPPEWSGRGAALLDDGDWIGVNPGAAFGSAKRWLPERFAAAADQVARRAGARTVVLGARAERALGDAVASAMRTEARNLCGETDLSELAGVLARLRLLLTGDSGPMHVAAALGVPLVAVFGPTDWRETAPVGERHRLVREPVHCAPCLLRECPIDHRCMRRVDADRVATAAFELLAA
ncbi:MAG TPA: lipopolysaccharide heptosyltransferase II [Vicinamibacteria bacterium]|jgi:heptosyltransferase-2